MSAPLIKICGVTDPVIAREAIAAGADFIGLVFAKDSPRKVSVAQGQQLVQVIRQNGGVPVGVFSEQDANEIEAICAVVDIELVQLHGVTARKALQNLPAQLTKIYAVAASDAMGLDSLNHARDFILFDGEQAGSGIKVDYSKFVPPENFNYFIAGGLTAESLPEVLQHLSPYALDVSSGVEKTRGIKDIELIKQFIEVAHANYYAE